VDKKNPRRIAPVGVEFNVQRPLRHVANDDRFNDYDKGKLLVQ
jgi:hypothetical protein